MVVTVVEDVVVLVAVETAGTLDDLAVGAVVGVCLVEPDEEAVLAVVVVGKGLGGYRKRNLLVLDKRLSLLILGTSRGISLDCSTGG